MIFVRLEISRALKTLVSEINQTLMSMAVNNMIFVTLHHISQGSL